MNEYDHQDISPSASMDFFGSLLRLIASAIGVVIIIIGAVYAMKMFYAIYHGVKNPQYVEALIEQWMQILGKESESITIQSLDLTFNLGRVTAVVILGGTAYILASIAISLMSVGAKIVSWTSGDREAVKRILTYTFGSRVGQHASSKKPH